MDGEYERIRRNAIITTILGITLVIGLFTSIILLIHPPKRIPGANKAEQAFLKNQEDFVTVSEYLAEIDGESISIWESDGTMTVDFKDQKITDQNVAESIKRLFYLTPEMQIYKSGNSIEFHWWSHWVYDISSCIVYSVNENELPNVQFATEITPMSESGWYYIVKDYNQWRVENT